jgi:hypothetical protein
MPKLNYATYRRDYKGEAISYVDGDELKSLFVNSRNFPYDRSVSSAVVLGNGISRLNSDIKLILNQNNKRVAEGYKTTYACNAAYRDTAADYYVIKNRIFFAEIPLENYNKMFVPNDMWVTYRDTNLIPYFYYMDSGASAAYLAAFDGAKKVFLFGFDGSDDETNKNVYANSLGYESNDFNHQKHHLHLVNVCNAFKTVDFYRVRAEHSHDYSAELTSLPNYHEISVREAILTGDF